MELLPKFFEISNSIISMQKTEFSIKCLGGDQKEQI